MLRSPLATLLCVLALIFALTLGVIPAAGVWVAAVALETLARQGQPQETSTPPVHRDPDQDERHI